MVFLWFFYGFLLGLLSNYGWWCSPFPESYWKLQVLIKCLTADMNYHGKIKRWKRKMEDCKGLDLANTSANALLSAPTENLYQQAGKGRRKSWWWRRRTTTTTTTATTTTSSSSSCCCCCFFFFFFFSNPAASTVVSKGLDPRMAIVPRRRSWLSHALGVEPIDGKPHETTGSARMVQCLGELRASRILKRWKSQKISQCLILKSSRSFQKSRHSEYEFCKSLPEISSKSRAPPWPTYILGRSS